MNKKKMLKGFVVAALLLVIGIIIVLVSGGFASLVSSVGTAMATLGISHALRTFESRNATCPVTTIGSASVENGTLTFYKN